MRAELGPAGFELFHQEEDGPFGSKYIEMRCAEEAIRFVWDGKESWFVLERCGELTRDPRPKWHDIRLERIKIDELDPVTSAHLESEFQELIRQLAKEDRAA